MHDISLILHTATKNTTRSSDGQLTVHHYLRSPKHRLNLTWLTLWIGQMKTKWLSICLRQWNCLSWLATTFHPIVSRVGVAELLGALLN